MFRLLLFIPCFFTYVLHAGQTRILSLDGGGVRGVVTLELLSHLQEGTQINFHDDFDIYAGTSTGSIIAFSACLWDACQSNTQRLQRSQFRYLF